VSLRPHSFCIGLACLLTTAFISGAAFTQDQSQTSNPAGFLIQAAKSYGLNDSGMKPWHLRATFKILDPQGNVTDQGIYEKFWVGVGKFKRAYTSGSFTQALYSSEKGVLFTGNPNMTQRPIFMVPLALESPMVGPWHLTASVLRNNSETIEAGPTKIGSAQLRCYNLTSTDPAKHDPLARYCFDQNNALARFSVGFLSTADATFKNPVNFDGHLVPGDVVVEQNGVPVLSIHLEKIESFTEADKAQLLPPAYANRMSAVGGIRGGMLEDHSSGKVSSQ
jgi:hypothetical protein